MTGESSHDNPEQASNTEKLNALAGFVLIAQHNPKSPESRILDEWQYEAAGLRTDEERSNHMQQRFNDWLASDEQLVSFYVMAQEDLR